MMLMRVAPPSKANARPPQAGPRSSRGPLRAGPRRALSMFGAAAALSAGVCGDVAAFFSPPRVPASSIPQWKVRRVTRGSSAPAGVEGRHEADDGGKDGLLGSLRGRRADIRLDLLESHRRAAYEAARRTYPGAAIRTRIEKGLRRRRRMQRESVEKLYLEKKGMLDAEDVRRRPEPEEMEVQRKHPVTVSAQESKAFFKDDESINKAKTLTPKEGLPICDSRGRRGMPIFDRSSFAAEPPPPLLVGATLIFHCCELTPFQNRAIEVAQEIHEEHVERMKAEEVDDRSKERREGGRKAGEEGGILAAPIVAVVDSHTGAATDQSMVSSERREKCRRYATLAAVEYANRGAAVRLTGVGRAFLRDPFSSEDAGLTVEEVELSGLLARILEFGEEEDEGNDDLALEEHDRSAKEDNLSVIVAEFDLLLDDSSVRSDGAEVTKRFSSPVHAVTELYRSANGVYRLHEERRKIVAGLRAGFARLRLGGNGAAVKGAIENCPIEFEDCDGIGLSGQRYNEARMLREGNPSREMNIGETYKVLENIDVPRSRLESLENYGLGMFGILSTVPDLTQHLTSLLEPYYSPSQREREEYEAEVASFAAFRALEGYASPDEVALALLAMSATRRLEMARGIMERHLDELSSLAEILGMKLEERGQKWDDLW